MRQTRDRFNVGEVTRTDVAQAESRVAAGQSQMLTAQANLTTSRAIYRRVIGLDPGKLVAGTPVDRFSPRTLDLAVAQGQAENPSVNAAEYGVDVAQLQVKVNEGSLYPTVTITGSAQQQSSTDRQRASQMNASVIGQLTVPIYQGGPEYSLIRQAKETVGQRRLELALNRDQARANVVQAWGQLDAAKAQIDATKSQVTAAEIALNGVREEARVGQRTTLDVLNAQQELVNARVALVTAQRDRVVASYALLAACRPAVDPGARPAGSALRSDGPLPAGSRRLDRNPYPGRALTVRGLRNSAFVIHILHKSYLPRTHGLQYSLTRPKTAIVVLDSRLTRGRRLLNAVV